MMSNKHWEDRSSWWILSRFLVFSLIAFIPAFAATDKIYLKDKTVVEGKITLVTETGVEVDPIGDKPFIIVFRKDVAAIIYSDNRVVSFSDVEEETVEDENHWTMFEFEIPITDVDYSFEDTYKIDETSSEADTASGKQIEVHLSGSFRVGADRGGSWGQVWGIEVSRFNISVTISSPEGTFRDAMRFNAVYPVCFGEEVTDGFEEIELGPYEAKFVFTLSDVRLGKRDPDGVGHWRNATLGMVVELQRRGGSR